MNRLSSLASEIEQVVASGDPARRSETLQRVTDLFLAQGETLPDMHVAIFDEVILRLARGIEFRVRVELAEKLADHAGAPRATVRELAFDENAEVAAPVIERSPRLDEDDLVDLAERRGQEHLRAMSRRSSLSARVTDILVRRGDSDVVRQVAENDGARFSETGFGELLEKARHDVILQRMLQARCDIPPREMAILVEIAREKVREIFRSDTSSETAELVDTTINDVAADAVRDMSSRVLLDDYAQASAAVAQRAWKSPLSEADIVEMLNGGRVDEALVALAQLSALPVHMVARAYHASHYDPLLFIVRAAGFDWETFRLMLVAKAGRRSNRIMLDGAFDAFRHLSPETARNIVRLGREREKALHPADG